MENNKYEKGKIYLITDVAYTKCYYGSTCEELSKRFWRHKCVYEDFLDGKHSYKHSVCELFNEFGVENCKIELVELFPTQSKIELLQREGYYIKNNVCVNKEVAGRTPQEYYQDNKEKYSKQNKEWHKNNEEYVKQRRKEHREQNLDAYKQREKDYRENNKETLRAKNIVKTQCGCGGSYVRKVKARHFRTKKHQEWLKAQQEE